MMRLCRLSKTPQSSVLSVTRRIFPLVKQFSTDSCNWALSFSKSSSSHVMGSLHESQHPTRCSASMAQRSSSGYSCWSQRHANPSSSITREALRGGMKFGRQKELRLVRRKSWLDIQDQMTPSTSRSSYCFKLKKKCYSEKSFTNARVLC